MNNLQNDLERLINYRSEPVDESRKEGDACHYRYDGRLPRTLEEYAVCLDEAERDLMRASDEIRRLTEDCRRLSNNSRVPEGWKLVPLLATPGMLVRAVQSRFGTAANKVFGERELKRMEEEAQDDYRAMLAAAPEAPKEKSCE